MHNSIIVLFLEVFHNVSVSNEHQMGSNKMSLSIDELYANANANAIEKLKMKSESDAK